MKEYGGNSQVTEYQYDQNGNVKTIKDAHGKLTSFTYTSHDELATVTNALNELTTTSTTRWGTSSTSLTIVV